MPAQFGPNLTSLINALESQERRKIMNKELTVGTCRECGGEFIVKRHWQVYCSKRCREEYHKKEMQEAKDLLRKKKQTEINKLLGDL